MSKFHLLTAAALATSLIAAPALAKDTQHKAKHHKSMTMQKQSRNWDRSPMRDYDAAQRQDFARDNSWRDDGWRDRGFWPADAAAGIAGAAVGTAGAIATAPFRGDYNDSYAAYDGDVSDNWDSGWNTGWSNSWESNWDNSWDNGWAGDGYRTSAWARQNGMVCTPGTWYRNTYGKTQLCQ